MTKAWAQRTADGRVRVLFPAGLDEIDLYRGVNGVAVTMSEEHWRETIEHITEVKPEPQLNLTPEPSLN